MARRVGQHPKCLLMYDEYNGDYECGYGTTLLCEDCKYSGLGRRDPEAKCNQPKEVRDAKQQGTMD